MLEMAPRSERGWSDLALEQSWAACSLPRKSTRPPPPPDYYAYYGYDYGPVDYGPDDDYGPDYGPPPPPRPYPRLIPPKHRNAIQSHAEPTSAKHAKAASSPTPAQKSEAKFKAAQAKAKREGVENLTQEDIEGLSYAQLKQLRGY
jgi:hypothetical protein